MPIRTTIPIYLLALSTQYRSPQNRVVINGHPTYRHSPSLHPSKACKEACVKGVGECAMISFGVSS